MKESIGNIEQPPTPIKKLMDYFPSGEVHELQLSDIPADVLEHFEGKSSCYILPENYHPGNFQTLFLLEKTPNEKIFGATQTKTYGTENPDTSTEELTYLVDVLDDKITGYGEIRFNTSKENEYFKDKPFVGFTRTYKEFMGKNLGTQRLQTMNEVCLALYKRPLSSDSIISEPAKKVWEKLAAKGEAEIFKEGTSNRYRFTTPQK